MFKNILKKKLNYKYTSSLFVFLIFISLPTICFASSYHPQKSSSKATPHHNKLKLLNRIGVSIGGAPTSVGGLIDYDRLDLFPDPHWSLGGEIGLYGLEFTIMPRALRWENLNMSGFYAGPKAYFSNGEYHHHEYRTFFGIGAEGGWVYRFPENFDIGAGIDLSLTSDGPWGSVKITAGYLF